MRCITGLLTVFTPSVIGEGGAVPTEYTNALINHARARPELERAVGAVSPELLSSARGLQGGGR